MEGMTGWFVKRFNLFIATIGLQYCIFQFNEFEHDSQHCFN
jgi:hypothetical protein